MFFNMSEIADETTLATLTQPIRFFNEKGIPVQTAMQNDVTYRLLMANYFPGLGVKYLIMGEHGHRARIPFDLPTAFWWDLLVIGYLPSGVSITCLETVLAYT